MNQTMKKWTMRLAVTIVLITGLLVIIVLNPILTYANKTQHELFTIYSQSIPDPLISTYLDQANDLLKKSELYHPNLRLDICLNDGSDYPDIIRGIIGQAFAMGFYNKVVLQGNLNTEKNVIELNGYKWNFTQLLAHEMIHCLQFDKLGLWKSKPIADIDNWKWEGYAEYISRQRPGQCDLFSNLKYLQKQNKGSWEIVLEDSTISPREYFQSWTLVQYCMDVRKMTFTELLQDTTGEILLRQEMKMWFEKMKI